MLILASTPTNENVYSTSEFESAPKQYAKPKKLVCFEAQIHNRFDTLCGKASEEIVMGLGGQVSEYQPALIKSKPQGREKDGCLVAGEVFEIRVRHLNIICRTSESTPKRNAFILNLIQTSDLRRFETQEPSSDDPGFRH